MVAYNSKKRVKSQSKGAKVKPIEEMVDKEKTSADSYFEKLEESKKNIKGDIKDMNTIINDVEIATEVERQVKEVALEVVYNEEVAMDIEETLDEEVLQQKEILDSHIRYAIYTSRELGKRGILSKQFKAIVKGYERTLGVSMCDEQQLYLKRLTEVQGAKVLAVINAYNRYKTNKEIQARINARKLATNE